MLQPPEGQKECPRCGYEQAILIQDFDCLLPQLDSFGYPHYHCPRRANIFTALDMKPDAQGKEKTH